MTTREIPAPWQPVFDAQGISGIAALESRIAEAGGKVHKSTLGPAIDGDGRPSANTVARIAEALRITPDRVHELRAETAQSAGEPQPFILPRNAALLDAEERQLVGDVVATIVEFRRREDEARRQEESLRAALRQARQRELKLTEQLRALRDNPQGEAELAAGVAAVLAELSGQHHDHGDQGDDLRHA